MSAMRVVATTTTCAPYIVGDDIGVGGACGGHDNGVGAVLTEGHAVHGVERDREYVALGMRREDSTGRGMVARTAYVKFAKLLPVLASTNSNT